MSGIRTIVLCVATLSLTTGLPITNQCVRYTNYNDVNWRDGRDRLCTSRGNITFCKEWECPEPDCDNPLSSEYNICSVYCEGTCTYGGKAHRIGESFISPDGFNNCWCGQFNSYFCSYAGFTVDTMCGTVA